MANEWGADYFVSIHCNAGGGTGTEVYSNVYGSKAYKLSECIQKRIVKRIGLSDRGVKTANFAVLTGTNMPAVLVETAFIDKAQDAKILGSESGREDFATAIAEGISDFLGTNLNFEEDLTMTQYEELKNEISELTETVKLLAEELYNLKNPMIYNYIDENMPEWARESVRKAVEKGIIKGDDNGLNLTYGDLRSIVREDRAGVYE